MVTTSTLVSPKRAISVSATGKPKARDLEAALAQRYAGSRYVKVVAVDTAVKGYDRIEPQAPGDTASA